MSNGHFTPEFFAFLTELAQNNRKPWFDANKARYEAHVRDAMVGFLADLAGPLRAMAPHFVVDPRPVGGSMMRIYRDTRFSKDKAPYKTSMAAQFRHENGARSGAPALYLRLGPGSSTLGAGLWQPEPAAQDRVRQAIVARPDAWLGALGGAEQRSICGFMGESLKKAPAGYAPDHRCIEDIKRKDFAIGRSIADADVLAADFRDQVLGMFASTLPFVQFLSGALGLPE